MAIDANAGFDAMVDAWITAKTAGALNDGQGFWHAGNTLDTYVTYLVQTTRKDDKDIVVQSYKDIFNIDPGTPQAPRWWRDDYGWWGLAFLAAANSFAAPILGLSPETVGNCLSGANLCWNIMNYDWIANKGNGVRNDPRPNSGVANTITNVLFMMLGLRRYQTTGDVAALKTAGDVFDWFYPNRNNLFNKDNLIRETPVRANPDYPQDRAWTGDQGWFWRACTLLGNLDGARKQRIQEVLGLLEPAIYAHVFNNGIVRELPYRQNYDVDYATGIGVFMRQFSIVAGHSPPGIGLIRQSAQGAWDNSQWRKAMDKDWYTGGCWYAGGNVYEPQRKMATWPVLVWDLTVKTAAQDAFNADAAAGPE